MEKTAFICPPFFNRFNLPTLFCPTFFLKILNWLKPWKNPLDSLYYGKNPFLLAGLIFFFIFAFLLCTFGLIGNLLVLISICIERRLQNTTNYFLFSLALADLLVCLVVMPYSLAELGTGFKWTFLSCLAYLYTDVFLCSASICHMAVISLDRYLGISQPLKRHRNRQKRTVALKIIFVWLLTILISSPLAILSFIDHLNILNENECGIRSRFFMLYGSTFSFLIPVVVLTVTTSRTTNLLKKQAKMLSNKNGPGGMNELRRTIMMPARKKFGRMDSNNLSTGSRSSQSGGVLARLEKTNSSTMGGSTAAGGRLSLSTGPPKRRFQRQMTTPERPPEVGRRRSSPANDVTTMLPEMCQHQAKEVSSPTIKVFGTNGQWTGGDEQQQNDSERSSAKEEKIEEEIEKRPSCIIQRLFPINTARKKSSNCSTLSGRFERMPMPIPSLRYEDFKNRKRRLTGSKKAHLASEQKATRVLIIQIVCFFFCWTPFFVQNIILGICGLDACGNWFPSWSFICAVWFGYFSSVLNPIIYTIFNRRFRESFIRIIQCHYWAIRRESGSTKFWPTLTEAAGINTTLNSLCQKFSRKPASISYKSKMPVTTQRRSSYAGEVAIWQNEVTTPPKVSTARRSTLMLPGEIPVERRFVARRLSIGATTILDQHSSLMLQINSSRLYTISDSDEDDGDKTVSQESRSEDNSRKASKITLEDVGQLAKSYLNGFIRKVSWRGIGRSASNIFHHGHGSNFDENDGERRRKITPQILFPIGIQEILALGTDRKKSSELNNNINKKNPAVIVQENGAKKVKYFWKGMLEAEEEVEGGGGGDDDYSLNSCSIISTAEDFFAQRITQITSNHTAV